MGTQGDFQVTPTARFIPLLNEAKDSFRGRS
jgi:hypothetical protein